MARRVLAAAAVILSLAACTPSKVDPDAQIEIGGSLRRQNGTPVPDASLALSEGADFLDVFSTITTLGLACLNDELPNACDDARIAQTDTDGSFLFDLKGSDTQSAFGNASTMEVSSHLPRRGEQLDGASVTMRFQVQTERLNLPLRFWEPSLRVTGDVQQVQARWSALPANILPPQASVANVKTSLRFSRGTERVWSFPLARSGQRFDPRYLEDSNGSVALVAQDRGLQVGESFGTKIDVIWRSARFPYVSPIGAPASRNAPCFAYDSKRRPVAQATCRITDGVFNNELAPATVAPCEQPTACPEPRHRAVYLDLGRVRSTTLVVLRECEGRCVIELSADTKKWRLVGSGAASQRFIAVSPPAGVRARYVRVRSDEDLTQLAEVSVWDRSRPARKDRPAGNSLLTSLRDANQSPLTGSPDSGGGGLLKIVLLVLAVVGIAGAAFALGRVRGRRAA